jgi:hypothetical protein
MMHASLDRGRLALLAGASLALCACFDTRLSLGHHSAPIPPPAGAGGAGGTSGSGGAAGAGGSAGEVMMDASIDPSAGSGGQGGSTPMEIPDAGPSPELPCDPGTFAVQLDCQVEDGFFGAGGPGSEPMSTRTTLTITPRQDRPGVSRATGVLSFSAWGLEFDGRIEGNLDCVRGVFDAFIIDGQVMMPNTPPGPFFGHVDGLLDPLDGTISGPWWHGPEMQGGPRCTGPWRATRN